MAFLHATILKPSQDPTKITSVTRVEDSLKEYTMAADELGYAQIQQNKRGSFSRLLVKFLNTNTKNKDI